MLPLAVDLRGVRKSFGPVQAVRGVALTIGSGEVMAFLGPNGAGKTSTIDIILGLSRPDSGAVEVYGMTPRQAVRRGLVSAVMQSGGLLKDLTVAETVQYTANQARKARLHDRSTAYLPDRGAACRRGRDHLYRNGDDRHHDRQVR